MTKLPEWTGPRAPDIDALPQLSALEAFDAMRLFVEAYWERGLKRSDVLRLLLSALDRDSKIFDDGGPADIAQWLDWVSAVEQVKGADVRK